MLSTFLKLHNKLRDEMDSKMSIFEEKIMVRIATETGSAGKEDVAAQRFVDDSFSNRRRIPQPVNPIKNVHGRSKKDTRPAWLMEKMKCIQAATEEKKRLRCDSRTFKVIYSRLIGFLTLARGSFSLY